MSIEQADIYPNGSQQGVLILPPAGSEVGDRHLQRDPGDAFVRAEASE